MSRLERLLYTFNFLGIKNPSENNSEIYSTLTPEYYQPINSSNPPAYNHLPEKLQNATDQENIKRPYNNSPIEKRGWLKRNAERLYHVITTSGVLLYTYAIHDVGQHVTKYLGEPHWPGDGWTYIPPTKGSIEGSRSLISSMNGIDKFIHAWWYETPVIPIVLFVILTFGPQGIRYLYNKIKK